MNASTVSPCRSLAIVLGSLWALSGCGSDAIPVVCADLTEQECAASDECGEAYMALPMAEACVYPHAPGSLVYIACREDDGRSCTMAWVWAHPDDDPDDWHWFTDGCLPEGWEGSAEHDPCDGFVDASMMDADVHGADVVSVVCADLSEQECASSNACGEPYMAIPKEQACVDPDVPSSLVYIACRDESVRYCTMAFVWAHPDDDPDDWHWFADGCLPDGWAGIMPGDKHPCDE